MTIDLASFVAGIGTTANFTPGVNTPAPFNVPFIGLTDGTGPTSASNNMAEVYNRILLAIYSVVEVSGLSVDPANWTQLSAAVQAIAAAAGSGVYVPISTYNSDFVNSLLSNGYAEIHGGLILQWRPVACPGGGSLLTVANALHYPAACLAAVCASGSASAILSISSFTQDNVTVQNGGGTGYVISVGH